ncbi:putative endolysin [Liberibacter phage P-PA19-1]|nr:putative endolysin [Liberibacter phage P-PA19-1]
MYFSSISDDQIRDIIEEWKNGPRNPPLTPKWYTGLGKEVINTPARALDKLVAPFREEVHDNPDYYRDSRSDPNTMGVGAHLVEGLTSLAPFAAGAALVGGALSLMPTPVTKLAGIVLRYAPQAVGALYAYLSHKAESSMLHQTEGLDKETADALSWREAIVHTSALLAPAAIASQSIAKTVASGAVLNVPFGMVERGWSSKVLEDHGYSEMAQHYRIFDMESLITDGLIGAFFGGMHSKQVQNMSLRLINDLKEGITERLPYKHAVKSSSPGLHTNFDAYEAHTDTLAHGVDSLERGEYPHFDQEKLQTIADNTLEDPHFKPHLSEPEPQPQHKDHSDRQKPGEHQAERPHTERGGVERELSERERANKESSERKVSVGESHNHPPFDVGRDQKLDPKGDTQGADFTDAPHAKFDAATFTESLSRVDEQTVHRFSELTKKHPVEASEALEGLQEKLQRTKEVKTRSLVKEAINCFLRTGGS